MKVLVILTGAMQFDGITNSVYSYYEAMDCADMQIDIVSARNTNTEMKEKFEGLGCRVFMLENRDLNIHMYFWQLLGIIRRGKYDIVHAHGNSATLAFETTAAWLAGCKIRIIHSRNSSCEHKTVDKILRPLMYATYTDGFACGQKAGEWLFKNRKFTIIQNGKNIDKYLFQPEVRERFRRELQIPDDIILIGHVGLFHKQKNHEFLIDVFSEINQMSENYRLVLIGEGEEESIIRHKVQSLGLEDKVLFAGRQSDVAKWLQAFDIMVFPSWYEGMPNVVLEWQIAGLPSVISDRITRECQITPLVEYYPLEKNAQEWAEKILSIDLIDREGQQETIKRSFSDAGYDIVCNATKLKTKYVELVQQRK